LATLGLGRVLAGELADRVAHVDGLNAAWQQVTQHLMTALNSLSSEELCGFRIKAIIGGSGSGKTQTAAALMQASMGYLSSEQIALVHCGDPSRDTALSQLATRLNVKQYSARSHDELAEALSGCRWAREIIIDTPALSPALGSQDPVLTLLSRQRGGLAAFVALPATASSDHLREILDHCCHLPLAGVITTKVDEATSLGAVIDAVVATELALAGRYDVRTNSLLSVSGDEMLSNAKRLAKRSLERQAAQLKVAV
jgi:flagellar biosynthesis protein FlhF